MLSENPTTGRKITGQICTRCIYDQSLPSISFDRDGVCNYCHMVDRLSEEYGTGTPRGLAEIRRLVDRIREEGKGRPYDCVVGVSGGTDSSFLICWALENGLRPLAVHYDNTWNTAIATENIRKVLSKLNVDLFTLVVNNREADDIFRAFFLASVPEIEASTDLALAETMYRAASKYGIRNILEGHSFTAEGITPLGKNYFDGRYIASIHKQFGSLPMKSYPNMTFWRFLRWTALKRIRKIRPLWYIDYSKEQAKEFLTREFDWQYYGGHHLENRMTAFFHSYYSPRKFDIDYRNNSLSAAVRSGIMTREQAIEEYYHQDPYIEPELVEYLKKRLGFSEEEFASIMAAPPKYWTDYPTYKERFERLRPLFYLMMKAQLVPHSFYLKYCFKPA